MPTFKKLGLLGCLPALAALQPHEADAQTILFGLTPTNSLAVLADDGRRILDGPAIQGVGAGESVAAIDYRPFTGALYAVSTDAANLGRLYVVHPGTGSATPVPLSGPDLVLTGSVDIDFNPAALTGTNALRVVTTDAHNYRLVFNDTGAVVNVDTSLTAPAGAPTPRIAATAYSNNRAGLPGGAGLGGTTQFAVDAASDQLYRVNPPNAGVLTQGLPLGVDISEDASLDVVTGSDRILAILTVGGAKGLYQIDPTSGAASLLRTLDRDLVDLTAPVPAPAPLPLIHGLATGNMLVRFSATGGPVVQGPPIVGIPDGETIVGIDCRPLTGELHAVTRDASQIGRLYRIDVASGAATALPLSGPALVLNGQVDIDFNPAALSGVNALRILTGDAINYRLVFDAVGAVVNVDTPLNIAGGSPEAPSGIFATAYANNRSGLPGAAGAGGTSQYALDSDSDVLYQVNPPNGGVLTNAMVLGFDVSGPGGLDIDTRTDRAIGIVSIGDVRLLVETDLANGGLVPLRTLPDDVLDLAIPMPAAFPSTTLVGLTATSGLVTFSTDSDSVVPGPVLSGLPAGETVVGIDFRPFDGRLYALTVATNGIGSLHTIDLANGELTPIPLSGAPLTLAGSVGIDFNPAASGGTNALRILTAEGANYRLVFGPGGATVNVDTALNLPDAPAPHVTATAYSNNRAGLPGGAGQGGTLQYAIDTTRDTLFRVNPPNGGVLTEPKPLGFDVRTSAGLDLVTSSDRALAVLDVDGAVGLYEIQIATGAAQWIRGLPANVVDLAVPMSPTVRFAPGDASVVAFGGIGPFAVQRAETVTDPFCTVTVVPSGTIPFANEGSAGFLRIADLSGAARVMLNVALSGAAERPNPVETPATGIGTLEIEGNTLKFQIEYTGLTTPASMAHIHGPADSATAAGVMIDLAPFNGGAFGTSGTLAGSVGISASQKAAILSGRTYVNIHTATAPGGELRGQIGAATHHAVLSGGAERPASVATAGTGFATFRLTGHELALDVSYRGLGSPAVAAHIHGPAGSSEAGGVMIDLAPFHQGSFGTFGAFRGTVTLTPEQLGAIVDGKAYVNIHTTGFGGGEVRGQIRPVIDGMALTANLDGASEKPNPVSTPGNGSAQFVLAGDLLKLAISYRGLTGPAVAAHLHGPAPATGTAGVQVDLAPFHQGPFGTEGLFLGSVLLTPAQKAALLDGNFYVNIHTAANAGGEIRGQIIP
ncbi:MAG: DUF4394 domain-containing protein [Limisphaerales bacterium]